MRCFGSALILLFSMLWSPLAQGATELPNIRGQLLSDKSDTSLKELAAGRARLVLVAFSSEGGDRVRSLAYAIREDHTAEQLRLVHVAGLARVPGLFRGMARRSLKSDVPEERHDHVLVVVQEEQETALRQILGDGSAYVVGVDASGSVIGVLQAPDSDEKSELEALIARLL